MNFPQTIRVQKLDSFRGSLLAICAGMGLLSVWLIYFFFGHVARYEVSPRAHVEVTHNADSGQLYRPGAPEDETSTAERTSPALLVLQSVRK